MRHLVAFFPYVSDVNWSKSKCPYKLVGLEHFTIEEKYQF